MDNKLSELSKPVAWTSARSLDVRRKITAFTDVESAAEYASANCWEKIVPLYSQEYVSALLAERDAFEAYALAMRDEWRARGERIAELERANSAQDDHINQQQDRIESLEKKNGDLGRSLGAAEKLLATPVRLPKRWDVTGQINPPRIVEVQFEQQNRTHDQCAEAIRAAGFTVVVDGDIE